MAGLAIVVFTDLVDSTAVMTRLGDDRMNRIVQAHLQDIAAAVEEGGGRVVKSTGDGAMATFSSALGALRAAAAVHESLARLDAAEGGVGLAARVGVSAGEPIAEGDDLYGMPVVMAARLCAAAPAGGVLVHDVVATLVGSREGVAFGAERSLELKGVPGTVRAVPLPSAGSGPHIPHVGRGDLTPRFPAVLAAFERQPMVGRDAELDDLRAALTAGDRQAVLILGEPGIGKTRMAAALAAHAHSDGALVVLARCPPEAATPFEPWVRAVGELALAGDRKGLAAAAGPELSALVPELAELAAGTAAESADGARYRVLRGVGAALAQAAGDRRVCVVLDDAHWCDAASTQVLSELIERPPFAQLSLIVTARERDLGRGHPVSRALNELRRTRALRELSLDGLDQQGLAALVAARVGRAITPRVAARLLARTRGNPFFAGELVQDLDERGALREETLDDAPVPDAVAGLVDERLARLDPETERFLVAAAAIGPTAPVALAATAAGIADATAAVTQAVAERLVDEAPSLEPTVAFPHALIREAFAAMPEPVAAARLHHAIAEALDASGAAEPSDLARHRALAAPLTGPDPAIAAYRAAADDADAGHDHEAAAEHLDRAVALLPAGHGDRGRLMLATGDQHLLAANMRRARVAYLAAADEARSTGDAELLGRAALGFAGGEVGFIWEVGGEAMQASSKLLREALDGLQKQAPRLRIALAWRTIYNDIFDLTPEEAQRLTAIGESAMAELPADTALPPLLEGFVHFAAFANSDDAVVEPIRSLHKVASNLEREHPDDGWRIRALMWAAHAAAVAGEPQRCDELIERMAEVAERLGSPRYECEVDLMRAQRLIERGDFAAGIELLQTASVVLGRLRPDLQAFITLAHTAAGAVFFDHDARSAVLPLQSMAASRPWGALEVWLVYSRALAGDHEQAWARLDELLAEPDSQTLRTPDIHYGFCLLMLGVAAARIGHRAAGEQIRPLLEPLRPYVIYTAPSVAWGLVPQLTIGMLEGLAGRRESAIAELHTAVERADATGVFWARCYGRIELARALHRGGEAGDAEISRRILAEGEELARSKGAKAFVAEAATVRAEMEGVPLAEAVPQPIDLRPVRALAARSGRRALAAFVRGQDDAALERRFLAPRRQRALLRAMARGFQPGLADGFEGVIAYELEPYAIEAPPEAPWRWAIQVGKDHARVVEPAPLESAVTVHFGLADWVRVIAGVQDPITAMVAGRCRVEGDVMLAAQIEPMFSAR